MDLHDLRRLHKWLRSSHFISLIHFRGPEQGNDSHLHVLAAVPELKILMYVHTSVSLAFLLSVLLVKDGVPSIPKD